MVSFKILNKLFLLVLLFLMLVSVVNAMPYRSTITEDSDDGTEVSQSLWYGGGFESSLNYLGSNFNDKYDVGFRFHLNDLNQGETVEYARLRLASFGSNISSSARLVIEGVLQESPTTFFQIERPSQKNPKTNNKIIWEINENWDKGVGYLPLYLSSPDITPIINEILALQNWGNGSEGKTLIITIRDETNSTNEEYVVFDDFNSSNPSITSPVILEIYRNTYDTFVGKELLGRVTNDSVTINLYSLIDTDVYVEYGTSPGNYIYQTNYYLGQSSEKPIEIVLENLDPNTQYYYRLMYKKAGTNIYTAGKEKTFHTQRPRDYVFSFAIQADEHIQNMHKLHFSVQNLY